MSISHLYAVHFPEVEELRNNLGYIPVLQYLRPNGRIEPQWAPCPDEARREKAFQLIDAGLRFEAEVLTDGVVSMTIGDDNGDYAHALSANGPEIHDKLNELIDSNSVNWFINMAARTAKEEE